MCGRYRLNDDPAPLLETLGVRAPRAALGEFVPRYNIAPSEPPLPSGSTRKAPRRLTRVPVVRAEGAAAAEAVELLWPLVPSWAHGEVPRYATANARAETMHERNAFRHAWAAGQRCLVLASGFYEWQDAGERTRLPWSIAPLNERWFTFGGLWERSRDAAGDEVLSCTIVTMAANALMRQIHNAGANRHRMPLILPEEARARWLHGSVEEARALIAPYPAEEMSAWPISRAVNNPGVDTPELVRPLDADG